jgi:hypothetical protein
LNNQQDIHEKLNVARDVLDILDALAAGRLNKMTFAQVNLQPSGRATGVGKNAELQEFVPKALELRSEFNIPFWMSIFFVATNSDKSIPNAVLDAATFHQDSSQQVKHEIQVDKEFNKSILATLDQLPDSYVLTVNSQVITTDGQLRHIPMLDFRLKSSRSNHALVVDVVKRLNTPGVILDSGRSYHFYGTELIDDRELTKFLAKALLFTPLIDYRWIAHQLLEESCALRVSPGVEGQVTPTVVGVVK